MKTFEANKTIKELGIDTSRKFVVVYGSGGFGKGQILELLEDDFTLVPYFKDPSGREDWVELCRLAYYEEEMQEGDLVYVSDTSEEDALEEQEVRILLRKCNDGYICVYYLDQKNYKEGNIFSTYTYKYAVPIPKQETLEVTMQEIAEKFGTSVENLKINK